MIEHTCLTCKYEPDWGQIVGTGDYERQIGKCKWKIPATYKFSSAFSIENNVVLRWVKDEGIYTSCQTWEAK